MTEARRHHLVPRFYLDRFSDAKGQIYAYRRAEARGFTTSTTNAAVEVGFYDASDEDGRPSPVGENLLQAFESVAAPIFRKIDAGEFPLGEDDRLFLATFMAFQTTRTREFRLTHDELTDFFFRAKFELEYRSMPDTDIEGAREVLENFRIRPNANLSLMTMAEFAFNAVPHLIRRSWTLLRTEERSFLTSDRPVVLRRNEATLPPWEGYGVASADQIYFPLDPKSLLILREGASQDTVVHDVDAKSVVQINAAMSRWAWEWIFHHPEHNPLQGLNISRELPAISINGVMATPGISVWNEVRSKFLEPTARRIIHVQRQAAQGGEAEGPETD